MPTSTDEAEMDVVLACWLENRLTLPALCRWLLRLGRTLVKAKKFRILKVFIASDCAGRAIQPRLMRRKRGRNDSGGYHA
jgi:hypothetical protein